MRVLSAFLGCHFGCLAFAAGVLLSGNAALAADCPGNPDALGTSRTIVVDPAEHPRVGTMQYDETLPLRDHEVVLTFDDGPLPPNTGKVLDILAAQCVKATFFMIGATAKEHAELARKVRDSGHTIGSHSQDHPLSFERMPVEKLAQEVDDGIASIRDALGEQGGLSPFFRIPGLLRSSEVDEFLASRGLMTWSADFPADDWRHVSSARVVNLALSRLEAKGKGILLLHDIHERTVAALPTILRELKQRNFHVVQVVAMGPERPKTATEPSEWHLHPQAWLAATRWPAIPAFAFATTASTDVAGLDDLGIVDAADRMTFVDRDFRAERRPKVPLPPESVWPRQATTPPASTAAELAAPAEQLFRIGFEPARRPAGAPSPRPAAASSHVRAERPSTDYSATEREAMNELVRDSLSAH